MTVIITSGLRQEWCDFGESRMEEMGITRADIASRTNLSAQDLMRKICKTMKVSTARSRNFRQVRPGKTWQIAASDLFLENSDYDVWGWSSPDNIFFLDFWRDFEPETRFVLIYGSLAQYAAFEMSNEGNFKKSKDTIKNRWEAYHQELLRFYNENEENCTLINIARFDHAATEIARGLNEKFKVDTRLINTIHSLQIDTIKHLASETLLKDEIVSSQIFSEMENSADIPSDDKAIEPDLAWKALEDHQQALTEAQEATTALRNIEIQLAEKENWFENEIKALEQSHERQANALKDTISSFRDKLLSRESELSNSLSKTKEHKAKSEHLQSNLAMSHQQLMEYEKDLIELREALNNRPNLKTEHIDPPQLSEQAANNELLLLQLSQVQEELNYYFEKYNALANDKSTQFTQSSTSTKTPIVSKSVPAKRSEQSSRPTEYTIDLRKYVNGEGWHSPEVDGRWAGLDLKSTIKVKPLDIAAYKLELIIIDAMSLDIVKNMKFEFEGQVLKPSTKIYSHLKGTLAPLRRLKASLTNSEKPYPMSLTYTVPATLIHGEEKGHWIHITVPETQTPSDKGLNDFRDLSICVQTIEITKLN